MHPSDFNRRLRESNWFNALNPAKETYMSNQPNPAKQASDGKEIEWIGTVQDDWTTLELADNRLFAFNRTTGRVYKVPHPDCPFIQFPAQPTTKAARELTAAQWVNSRHIEVLRAMGSVFKNIPSPCEERDAIEAAIAALSQPTEPQGAVVVSEYVRGLGATEDGIRLASMIRDDVVAGDFTATLTRVVEAALPVAVGAGEDAKRLDWLMHKISGSELRDIGVWTFDGCTREAIDAAMTPATPAGKD